MDSKELVKKITAAIEAYIADEELYDDDAQIVIDPVSGDVKLVDGDEDVDEDAMDLYSVMDLVRMDSDGHWTPDHETIREIVTQS